MSPLLAYLETYQPQSDWERQAIAILRDYGAIMDEIATLKANGTDKTASKRLRKLENLELKRVKTKVYGEIFDRLPSLSHPRQYQAQEVYRQNKDRCDDDYVSLRNDVAMKFFAEILTEFEPEKSTQGKTLTAKLSIWVNSKLRLKWGLINIIYPDRPNSDFKLWCILAELVENHPEGITVEDWQKAVKKYKTENNSRFSDATAAKFFEQKIPSLQVKEPDGDRLFLDLKQIQTAITKRMSARVESLDQPVGNDEGDNRRSLSDVIEDLRQTDNIPKLTKSLRFKLIFSRFQEYLESLCHRETPACNCKDVLTIHFYQKEDHQASSRTVEIVLGLEMNRSTYDSFRKRICLKELWELFLKYSPAAKPYGESQKNHFKALLEDRLSVSENKHPREIYYEGERKKMKGQKFPDCNAQSLAKNRLGFLGYPELNWSQLSKVYDMSSSTILDFWSVKCLPSLVDILFDLEDRYIDDVDLYNHYFKRNKDYE